MFKLKALCCVVLGSIAISAGFSAAVFAAKPIQGLREVAATPAQMVYTNQLVVKLRASETQGRALGPNAIEHIKTTSAVPLTYLRPMAGGAHVFRLPERVSLAQAEEIASRLIVDAEVHFAHADRKLLPALTPDDPRFNEQWHYMGPADAPGGANLLLAWDEITGSTNIVVAVLDTGLLPHVDIDTNIADSSGRVVPGFDFIADTFTAADGDGRDADPTDPGDYSAADECGAGSPVINSSWHGTHVAGTIGALTNNSIGVAGVNWASKILPVRVLGKCGGFTSDIVDGMYWAAGLSVPGVANNPTPAQVLNLSLGGSGPCSALEQDAVNAVVAAGSVVVVAAGNDDSDASGYTPASCSGVIAVHAHDIAGQHAVYSNFGATIEISAPGGDYFVDPGVLSTADGGATVPANDNAYLGYQGTSMAAPHVAGIASLMLSKNPYLSPSDVLAHIQATAAAFPSYGDSFDCDTARCGAGMIDAAAAIAAVPDVTPDAFSFTDQAGVEPSATVTSNAITVGGIEAATAISVAGGQYSIGCTATFTSASGTISNGQTVCVRHTASSAFSTAVNTTLTIGGVADTFTSTTRAADTTPDTFSFTDQAGVEPSATVTSNAITVGGIEAATAISVAGGQYSIGCTATFTSASGTISNGQTVCVRHTASSAFSTAVNTTLTIGGVADTFTSTTRAAPANATESSGGGGGGFGIGLLLPMLLVLGWRRRRRPAG